MDETLGLAIYNMLLTEIRFSGGAISLAYLGPRTIAVEVKIKALKNFQNYGIRTIT